MYAIYNKYGDRLYQYGQFDTPGLASHIANKVNETRPQLGANVREIIESTNDKLRKAENVIRKLLEETLDISKYDELTPEERKEVIRLLKEARKLIIKAIEIKK